MVVAADEDFDAEESEPASAELLVPLLQAASQTDSATAATMPARSAWRECAW